MKYLPTIAFVCILLTTKSYIAEAPIIVKPTDVKGLVVYYAKQYQVSAPFMEKIIKCESGGNPMATNITPREASYGIVQINRKAHPHISIEQARDIDFSTEFLAKNIAKGKASMWTCARKIKV